MELGRRGKGSPPRSGGWGDLLAFISRGGGCTAKDQSGPAARSFAATGATANVASSIEAMDVARDGPYRVLLSAAPCTRHSMGSSCLPRINNPQQEDRHGREWQHAGRADLAQAT